MERETEDWMSGFLEACRLVKSDILSSQQNINDGEARKVVDTLFNQVTHLEKSAFSYAPTVIMFKEPK